MWVHGSLSDYYEGQRSLPPAGGVLDGEGVYALASSPVPTHEVDGVAPMPGRDVLSRRRPCYWVTGVVSSLTRPVDWARQSGTQEFLLVAGNARLVTRVTLTRRRPLTAGDRCTLPCFFELVASHDWAAFDLPEDWAGRWRIESIIDSGASRGWDYILDLEATGS